VSSEEDRGPGKGAVSGGTAPAGGPVLVTATEGPLGSAIVKALARIGCDLALHAEDPARLRDVVLALRGARGRVHVVVGAPHDAAIPPLAHAFQAAAGALGPMKAAVCAELPDPSAYPESATAGPHPATAWSDAFARVRGAPHLLLSARGGLGAGGRMLVLRGVPAPGEDRPLLRAALQAADIHRAAATRELVNALPGRPLVRQPLPSRSLI
jgi:hypothetical protein